MTLDEVLTKLKDTNALIEPGEVVMLIEEVGMLIDDLDLEIIELEEKSNQAWSNANSTYGNLTKTEITNIWKLGPEYKEFREKTALLKRLRRHYRLLQTKLNLLTKPRGR